MHWAVINILKVQQLRDYRVKSWEISNKSTKYVANEIQLWPLDTTDSIPLDYPQVDIDDSSIDFVHTGCNLIGDCI